MEVSEDFGNPDVLVLAEDHIVLKLETALPPDSTLPEGFALGDVDGLLLVANKQSLVSASRSALLRGASVSKALFCGCVSFDSCDLFASAASELLRDAQEVHIVHNRNTVYKLIRMFPNAKHRSSKEASSGNWWATWGDQRTECPSISRATTLALIRSCPNVSRIDSRWVVSSFTEPPSFFTSTDRRKAKNFTHINLLDRDLALATGLGLSAVAADVAVAAKTFPSAEKLEVRFQNCQ
ncbi:hypothetical protein MRX96_025527 [Rhipicephalus microplus]